MEKKYMQKLPLPLLELLRLLPLPTTTTTATTTTTKNMEDKKHVKQNMNNSWKHKL